MRRWTSPYLDSELGDTQTFEVSQHLLTCPECAARFNFERHADARLRLALAEGAMPDALWWQIVHMVSQRRWFRRAHLRRAVL